ncbi:hypothetical protein [Flavobacterium sp.]|uniref:hypothetical protein n=1 Tax=Flavobacterium sp. TaxID=239 RepID=UPI00262E7628|nr:hypothetical protein [Flavobacterium sp.]
MKKEILPINELLEIGFQEIPGDTLDDYGYYRWFAFYKHENEIHITYEYSQNGQFNTGSVEFNGEELKGRELTKQDINFLIEIM